MAKDIKNIVVIGSGVMGASIAGHITNAGFKVILLDIVPTNSIDRNILAKSAIEKLQKSKPAALTLQSNINLIKAGNIEDNIQDLSEADWIIEVIVENLEIKKDLYKKLDKIRKKGSIISSNTSTLRLSALIDGMSDDFKRNFLISHFFNPPRIMKLFELISGNDTNKDTIEDIKLFVDYHLGKGVVNCKDTAGFIANRIGCFWLEVGLNEAIKLNISVAEADNIIGKSFGIPKTGIFGLWDLIGIDLMPMIANSILASLPKTDDYNKIYIKHSIIENMIKNGYIGRKGKGGFYNIIKNEDGTSSKTILNLSNEKYQEYKPPSNMSFSAREMIDKNQYAFNVMSQTLSYAAKLVPEISDDIISIDQAMKWGYGWQYGPFELIDMIGAEYFVNKLLENNLKVPKILKKIGARKFYNQKSYFALDGNYKKIIYPSGIIFLNYYKDTFKPLIENQGAALWDIGDGVGCIEFLTKMNMASYEVLEMIRDSILYAKDNLQALIIGSDADNFCVGGNLQFMLENAKSNNKKAIENYIKLGQDTMMQIKYADFPIISAVKGYALGGGSEILLHSCHVCAHIESIAGLVETKVGLIPGWGGTKEMIMRICKNGASDELIKQYFRNILTSVTSSCGADIKDVLLKNHISITMNSDRVLGDAKNYALTLAKNYQKPAFIDINLNINKIKRNIELVLEDKNLSDYDKYIGKRIAKVFMSGSILDRIHVKEQLLLDIEREEFLDLLFQEKTQERISHMLKTGKHLRN